jgi:hypothetical protein
VDLRENTGPGPRWIEDSHLSVMSAVAMGQGSSDLQMLMAASNSIQIPTLLVSSHFFLFALLSCLICFVISF